MSKQASDSVLVTSPGRREGRAGGKDASRRGPLRRDDVLDLSAQMFAAKGYRATNLKLVADQLGVTRQALYYLFTSKVEVLGALFDRLMVKLDAAADSAEAEGPESRFIAMVDGHARVVIENADLVSVLLHERPEIANVPDLHATERRLAYNKRFIKAFKEGVACGALRPADPFFAANSAVAAANAIVFWYHPGSRTRSEDVLSNMHEWLTLGFGAR